MSNISWNWGYGCERQLQSRFWSRSGAVVSVLMGQTAASRFSVVSSLTSSSPTCLTGWAASRALFHALYGRFLHLAGRRETENGRGSNTLVKVLSWKWHSRARSRPHSCLCHTCTLSNPKYRLLSPFMVLPEQSGGCWGNALSACFLCPIKRSHHLYLHAGIRWWQLWVTWRRARCAEPTFSTTRSRPPTSPGKAQPPLRPRLLRGQRHDSLLFQSCPVVIS